MLSFFSIWSDPFIILPSFIVAHFFSLTSNYAKIVIFVISGAVPSRINSFNPQQLHVYPNYLYVYTHHFITIGAGTMTIVLIYYFKNRQLWTFHKRQCFEIYESIKERMKFQKNNSMNVLSCCDSKYMFFTKAYFDYQKILRS